ncbi:MAG: YceK/YidQ family lipoprotein [Gemmataceae bacterium]
MLLLSMALGLTVAGTGCATALNLQEASQRKPYGGFTMPMTDFFGGGDSAEYAAFLFWPFWLLDKPLSLFADTLTLPYTLSVQHDAQTPPKSQNPPPIQSAPRSNYLLQ